MNMVMVEKDEIAKCAESLSEDGASRALVLIVEDCARMACRKFAQARCHETDPAARAYCVPCAARAILSGVAGSPWHGHARKEPPQA